MNATGRIVLVIIGLVLIWEVFVWLTQMPPYILPGPWSVVETFCQQYALLWYQAIPTLIETLLGLACGIFLGSFAAILFALYAPLRLWVWPLLLLSQAIPTFAIAPLLVIWLGYGVASKVAIAVLVTFFPVVTAFYDGLQRTPRIWLDLAHTMSASPWRALRHIRIPSAMPHFASGVRVATALAPIAALVGEWVGSSRGLGFIMLTANARMQINLMFAALVVIVVFSLALYFSVDALLKRFINWEMG